MFVFQNQSVLIFIVWLSAVYTDPTFKIAQLFGFGFGGDMVKKVRHFCISVIARVLQLIYGLSSARVFHVEIYRRARIPI